MNPTKTDQVLPFILKRVEDLIAVIEFHFGRVPDELYGMGSAISAGDVGKALEHSSRFLDFVTANVGKHEYAPTILGYASKTHAGLEIVQGWDDDGVVGDEPVGHDPAEIVTVYDANKWNHLTLESGKAYHGIEFFNDHWVGLHHPHNGKPLRDVTLDHLYAHDNLPWTSRAYEMQENIVVRNATVLRNRREHPFYWNVVGLGSHVSQAEANKRILAVFENIYLEDCDAQPWQIVGCNPNDTQRLDETGLPFEEAWSPAGRLIRRNARGKLLGRGRDTGHPDRVGFLISDFPYKSVVENSDFDIDNRGVKKGGGALLCLEHPEWHGTDLRIDFTGVDTDKEFAKFEDTPVVRLKGGRLMGGSRKQFFIRRCGDVVVEGVESDLDLYVDGAKVGKLADGYRSI